MTDETPQHPRSKPGENDRPAEDGFELDGVFYRWSVTDGAKDLMLVDRFAKMSITEFFAIVEDSFDRGRAPVLLALIATSVRKGHPEWSVDRVERLVMNLNLSDVEFIDADVEEDSLPPASEGAEPSTAPASPDSSSEPRLHVSGTAEETFGTSRPTLV